MEEEKELSTYSATGAEAGPGKTVGERLACRIEVGAPRWESVVRRVLVAVSEGRVEYWDVIWLCQFMLGD